MRKHEPLLDLSSLGLLKIMHAVSYSPYIFLRCNSITTCLTSLILLLFVDYYSLSKKYVCLMYRSNIRQLHYDIAVIFTALWYIYRTDCFAPNDIIKGMVWILYENMRMRISLSNPRVLSALAALIS